MLKEALILGAIVIAIALVIGVLINAFIPATPGTLNEENILLSAKKGKDHNAGKHEFPIP